MESQFDWDAWCKMPKGRNRSKELIRYYISFPLLKLLDDVLGLASGDEYEGEFSTWGWYEYTMSAYILKRRIRALEARAR